MVLLSIIEQMDDMNDNRTRHERLFGLASTQQGYFTAAQARECGFDTNLIAYHKKHGRFIQQLRGVYRLRDYPSSNRGEVVAAWLSAGKDVAVVSHESALDLLDLSDVIPRTISLTVPRAKRHLSRIPGVTIHTTTRPFGPRDVKDWEGVTVTSAARTILDVAEDDTAPEQVELAIRQAISRGLTTKLQLNEGAAHRRKRAKDFVAEVLDTVP
jgi:predicted transcriptional regulator of viral defense system